MTILGSFQIGAIGHVIDHIEESYKNLFRNVGRRCNKDEVVDQFVSESMFHKDSADDLFDLMVELKAFNDIDSAKKFALALAPLFLKESNEEYDGFVQEVHDKGVLTNDEHDYLLSKVGSK